MVARAHQAHQSHRPKRHLDRFSRFCMGSKCYAVQCIVNGKENPRNCPFPWEIITPPEEDRPTVIGNMQKKIGKDRACGSRDILADRQAHRQTHTQTCSSQYFATARAGEVNIQGHPLTAAVPIHPVKRGVQKHKTDISI